MKSTEKSEDSKDFYQYNLLSKHLQSTSSPFSFHPWKDNLWCERYGGNKKAVFLLVQPQMGRKWSCFLLWGKLCALFLWQQYCLTVKNVIDHRLSIKCTLTPLPTSLLMNQFPSDHTYLSSFQLLQCLDGWLPSNTCWSSFQVLARCCWHQFILGKLHF